MSEDRLQVMVSGLSRTFGARRAVDDVSFALRAGDTLAVFGPNGAGKTTLLRLLGGLLRPSAGEITIGGETFARQRSLRRHIGIISHRTMLYDALTPLENVEFAARLYGVADAPAAAREALRRMGVAATPTPARLLSRGMQQRVSIARAIVHSPRLLLADEPYSGLDESGAAALTSLFGELAAAGAAVVMVTHNLQEGLSLASRAVIMSGGRFVRLAEGEMDRDAFAAEYRGMVRANA